MDGASIYSPPKVGSGGYCSQRRLKVGNIVVLNFHAKPQLEGVSMWGRPASPRPAGLGIPPRGHRPSDSGSDHFLEAVGSWFCASVAVARPAGIPLAHLGL